MIINRQLIVLICRHTLLCAVGCFLLAVNLVSINKSVKHHLLMNFFK